MTVRGGGAKGPGVRHAAHAAKGIREERVRRVLDRAGHVGAGGPAMSRVVFESAVFRWIVRRRNDDAVRQPGGAAVVISKDRVRNHRRRRVAAIAIDHHVDIVRGQYLEGADRGRLRQRMRVDAEEQRTGDAVRRALIADRLGDRQHVRFVERARKRRTTMSRGSEGDAFGGDGDVRMLRVIRADEPRHVHEH